MVYLWVNPFHNELDFLKGPIKLLHKSHTKMGIWYSCMNRHLFLKWGTKQLFKEWPIFCTCYRDNCLCYNIVIYPNELLLVANDHAFPTSRWYWVHNKRQSYVLCYSMGPKLMTSALWYLCRSAAMLWKQCFCTQEEWLLLLYPRRAVHIFLCQSLLVICASHYIPWAHVFISRLRLSFIEF